MPPRPSAETISHDRRLLLNGAAALAAALCALAALGAAAVAFGVCVMIADALVTGEAWDGFGLFIGGLIVVGGCVWGLPHLGLALAAMHARRLCRDHGETEALRGCGGVAAVLGVAALALIWVVEPFGKIEEPGYLLVPTLLLVVSTAAGVLVTAAAVTDRPGPRSPHG